MAKKDEQSRCSPERGEFVFGSPTPKPMRLMFIAPCLPTISRTVPTGTQWAYEIKHDGFRFICRQDGERVRVFSQNGRDWTDRVPLDRRWSCSTAVNRVD